jgi:heptose-I-phosphate ethanolaminephosphotransferase
MATRQACCVPLQPTTSTARFGPTGFLLSLLGLGVLPLTPEVILFFRNHEDLKYFLPICYYEAIVSFLLLVPALFLGRRLARLWVAAIGGACALTTVIVGYQAATIGARWDLTAHNALMQTYPAEAWGYLRSFAAPGNLAAIGALGAGFIAAIVINVRSRPPGRRVAVVLLLAGLVVAARGVHNFIRYERVPYRLVTVPGGTTLRVAEVGINSCHPLLLFTLTHYNYRAMHAYLLRSYQRVNARRAALAGATVIPGALPPRVMVVVIGESANRLHWSLYGYARETSPRLEQLRSELLVFTDVISTCVGTEGSFEAMLTTRGLGLPIFPLFSQAGYRTHWLSAQYGQGENDVEESALVQSCDERLFLNGAYDGALVPLVRRAAAEPGRQLLFVNLFGSHVRYRDRYPARFARFHGNNVRDELRATYDNTMLYTDDVLARMIQVLKSRHEPACLLYVSDHGEDVYDSRPDRYLFRSDALATDPMYEVPFLVWLSPEYIAENADFSRAVAAARTRKYQTRALYQALIDLARLRHPLYDSKASLFSSDYVAHERRVGVAGRLYDR